MKAYQKETELADREYEDVLDEIYGDVEICGMMFSSGRALRELDPTAFNCGRNDYTDSLDTDNPVWICSECNEEFDNQEDAEACCQPETEE